MEAPPSYGTALRPPARPSAAATDCRGDRQLLRDRHRPAGQRKEHAARALANHLDLPLIHKDVVLESLHDSLEVGDHTWRHRLSLAANDILFALAADAGRATSTGPSPTDQIHERVALWASHPGPLTLGDSLRPIDTSRPVDIGALAGGDPRAAFSHTPRTGRRG